MNYPQQIIVPENAQQLTINSSERNGGNINDYTMTISLPVWKVQKVVFNELSMTTSWYTFNDTSYNGFQNNLITFMELGNPAVFVATIPIGNYSTVPNPGLTGYITIQDQVAASLNAVVGISGVYTCTYNYNTSIIKINSTVSFSLLWSRTNDCNKQLGFPNIDTAYATSQVGSAPVQLTNSGCMYISMSGIELPQVITSTMSSNAGQLAFCVQSDSNNLMNIRNNGTLPRLPTSNVTNSLRISVSNRYGQLLPLNVDWSISFVLFG